MSDTETEDSGAVTRRGFLRGATAGATATVAAGTAVGQETGSEGNASGNASGNQTGGGGGGGTEQVVVGPGGDFVFEPAELTIAPGTAVEFTWESDGHNVAPEEGDWGHLPIEDTGFSFTTPPFEETGSFPYVCEPHASAGMKGTIEVAEGGGGGGEGGGSSGPSLPDSAKTLGIAATTALASTLGLAYFFMMSGGDYGRDTGE
jgi:plastocyanin